MKKATLSVAAKAKAKAKKKEETFAMDVEDDTPKEEEDAKKDGVDEKKKEPEEQKKPEPRFEILCNPARVTWKQREIISFEGSPEDRYEPVKSQLAGIVMLRDRKEGEEEDIVIAKPPKIGIYIL